MVAIPSPADEDLPLSIEPIIGWRVWRLASVDGEPTLETYANHGLWLPQRVGRASCAVGRPHASPADHCSCGYYAADSIRSLMRANVFHNGVSVIGAVAMWGTVIEHAHGARAQLVYPARLRIVCGSCLAHRRLADADVVFEEPRRLVPMCVRHAGGRAGGATAAEVQAALLGRYEVELLPMPKVAPWPLVDAVPAGRGALSGSLAIARVAISFVIMMCLFAIATVIVSAIVGFVFGLIALGWDAVTGGGVQPPTAVVSSGPAADVHARSWRVVEPHRGVPPLPVPPETALPCGVGHGAWIELAPCFADGTDLLGFAERGRPRGLHHDCAAGDAYSRGRDWYVCWVALPGAFVHPWPRVKNPFRARDAGVIDGDR